MLGFFVSGAAALRRADRLQARRARRLRGFALGRVQRHRLGGRAPARLGGRLGHAALRAWPSSPRSRSPLSTRLPATLTLDAGGALNVLLFGLTVLALAWFAPSWRAKWCRASRISSGADAMRAGLGAAVIGRWRRRARRLAPTSTAPAHSSPADGPWRGRRRARRTRRRCAAVAAAAGGARPQARSITPACSQTHSRRPHHRRLGEAIHELAIHGASENLRAGAEPTRRTGARSQEWDRAHGRGGPFGARLARDGVRGLWPCGSARALALTIVALQQRTFVHVVEVESEGQVMNVRAAERRLDAQRSADRLSSWPLRAPGALACRPTAWCCARIGWKPTNS